MSVKFFSKIFLRKNFYAENFIDLPIVYDVLRFLKIVLSNKPVHNFKF